MVSEMWQQHSFILASASPRREYLLQQIGLDFETRVNDLQEETYPGDLSREEIPVYIAELKAGSMAGKVTGDTVIIAADTIVWLNGRIAGKPAGRKEAIGMLEELSGTMHEVITGVCFRMGSRIHSFHSSTLVWFTGLTREEILYYVDRFRPFDKAGGYGIQEWIGYVGVDRIEGSYYNVMGLPVQKVYQELKNFLNE